MSVCSGCHDPHALVGVMFPARRLCACERHDVVCAAEGCGAPAVIVEFQAPMRGEEPAVKDWPEHLLLCEAHRPTGFAGIGDDAPEKISPRRKKPLTRTMVPHDDDGYQVVFDRSFTSGAPDFGRREDIQVGDVVTFIPDKLTFISRLVAEVRGQIIVTEAFAGERPHMFNLACVTQVKRERKKESHARRADA